MSVATDSYRALARDCLNAFYAAHPTVAADLGLHEYDGRVPDLSAEALRHRAAELRALAARLDAIVAADLSPADAVDHRILRQSADSELFDLEEWRSWQSDPMTYLYALDVSGYVKRGYAPITDRVSALLEHLSAAPEVFAAGRANLTLPLVAPILEIALESFDGQIAYLETDLAESLRDVVDSATLSLVAEAASKAAAATREFRDWLLAHKADATSDFALGRQRYERMLSSGELIDLPLDRVLAIGEENLRRDLEAFRELTARTFPGVRPSDVMAELSRDHPTAADLVPETAAMLAGIRRFVDDHGLVTIPTDGDVLVEPTPRYLRWAFAMMSTPGPFERAPLPAFYYVTPVEPEWSPEKQEEWLTSFDYHTLRAVTIHEVYPGHQVQLLWLKQAPSDVLKTFSSYAYIEGWAHYCEQMMLDEGYGDGEPRSRLAQLAEALLRDCRYVASIRMHTQGMTVDEAARLFVEQAYMAELPARKEALRGTFDPGYLYYTLGKLAILRLREDCRRAWGQEYTLRRFHDRLLALGAPPLPLAREMLLGADSGPSL
jgi:uncharacterized protein (DUF885 family)